jgi:hypothetical protein
VTAFAPHALRDYALLADGERGAIVGPKGEVAWLCAPSWHSGSVFSSLIGGQGVYAICPADRFVWGGQYESRSLIWRNRWVTDTGSVIECREALAFPGDPHRLILLRRVLAQDGPASVRVVLEARGRLRPGADPRPAVRGRRHLDRPDGQAVPAVVRRRDRGAQSQRRPARGRAARPCCPVDLVEVGHVRTDRQGRAAPAPDVLGRALQASLAARDQPDRVAALAVEPCGGTGDTRARSRDHHCLRHWLCPRLSGRRRRPY